MAGSTCPDYALRQKDCKHLVAVQFRALRESRESTANGAAQIGAIVTPTATSRPKTKPMSTVDMGTDIEIGDDEGVIDQEAGDASEGV